MTQTKAELLDGKSATGNLKNPATADNSTMNLVLQTGETDIAADDVIGKISFQAPDEGTGTDAVLVAAAIQARSEGNFSSSSNATELQFMTGASEAATTKMTISSAGRVGIGTDAPDMLFDITGSVTAGAGSDEKLQQWNIGSDNVKAEVEYVDASADRGFAIGTSSQHDFLFRTNDTKRGKIDYNGDFIYGSGTTNDGLFTINHNAAGEYTFSLNNSVASGNIYAMNGTFTALAPDDNTSFFYWCNDNSTG